jgi:hypothetical protein
MNVTGWESWLFPAAVTISNVTATVNADPTGGLAPKLPQGKVNSEPDIVGVDLVNAMLPAPVENLQM